MAVSLKSEDLNHALEQAYARAIANCELPSRWIQRAERLADSPSVCFIAAVGAVLLAKATDERIDAFVIQKREGSAGAFSLRGPATALAGRRREFGYDIGSSSDKDPINHGTLVSSKRWDVALERIEKGHKPFCSLIITWLPEVNRMTRDEAVDALAAYIRVRRATVPYASLDALSDGFANAPTLTDLIEALDGFVGADTERGARGMALVACAYRASGFEVHLRSPTHPKRVDVTIKCGGAVTIAGEVKQEDVKADVADTLAEDARGIGARRGLLAVLPPGKLVGFDRASVVRRAEREHGMVMRVTSGTRELLHEAFSASSIDMEQFCAALPRAFAEALRDIRARRETIETWAALASRWQ